MQIGFPYLHKDVNLPPQHYFKKAQTNGRSIGLLERKKEKKICRKEHSS